MDNSHILPAEKALWKASPSQWTHIKYYLVCLLVAAAFGALTFFAHTNAGLHKTLHGMHVHSYMIAALTIFPLLVALGRYWMTTTWVYELTDQRMMVTRGVLSKHTADLELYRVKDYTLDEPFPERVFGLGNITVLTSDTATPNLIIRAIPNAKEKFELLRRAVEESRNLKRVRQMDVDTQQDGGAGVGADDLHHG